MALDAIRNIQEVEMQARKKVAEAQETARKMIQEAEVSGQKRVDSAKADGASEINSLIKAAELKAAESASELSEITESECRAIKGRAAKKTDDAVEFIVRRVVKA